MANKRPEWLSCVVCGTGFAPYNQVQLTCSKKCSRELAVRRTAKWRASNEIPALPETRMCACGKTFKPGNSTHKFCSRKCASRKQRQQVRKWKETNSRRNRLKNLYGLTQADYERMYREQDGKCLICQRPFDNLCIDHDHETGRVRGLLCRQCNAALGSFSDDAQLLHAAIVYLEQRGTS